MSFPGEGGVTKYSTLQGGCSDGSPLQIQVGSKPNWISAYPTGNYSIAATASPNGTGSSRSGSITILQFGNPIGVVSVSQPAGVFPVGQVSITSGPTQRCKGSDTSDYDANASNATSYSWSISGAWNSTINSSGTVNWDAGFWGTATISVTAHGANNSTSTATRNVTVTAVDRPNLDVPVTEICGTNTVTVTLQNLGDNTLYELLRNGSVVASIDTGPDGSPYFQPWEIALGGTYKIRGKLDGSPCSEEWGEFTITKYEGLGNPVLSDPGSRCKGAGTSSISVNNPSGDSSYAWTITNAGNSTINSSGSSASITWDPDFSGTATVRVEVEDECNNSTIRTRTISVTEPVLWYKDTDGDGYRDPGVPAELQCTSPSGNWTDDPQPIVDSCINYFNDADGTNGCNPNCLENVTMLNQTIVFSNQGGEETVTYSLPCSSGYNIEVVPNSSYDDWLEVERLTSRTFKITCDAGNEVKQATVAVTINGNSQYGSMGFGIQVQRGTSSNPDPDPDPCVASSMDDISFGASGGTQSVTVNYSGDCVGTLELRNPYQPIPEWLEVTPGPGTTFILSVEENSENTVHNTILSPMMSDGNGNYMGMGVTFIVTQEHLASIPSENYIYTRTYQKKSAKIIDPLRFTQNDSLVQNITYFDGLGRPIQQVGIALTPKDGNGQAYDVVTPIGYDSVNRKHKEWLPYVDIVEGLGSLRVGDTTATKQYYLDSYPLDFPGITNVQDINAFSQKQFESSPLNRILKQAAPGTDWAMNQGNEIEFNYTSNISLDEVRQFEVNLTKTTVNGIVTFESILTEESPNIMYDVGELYKTITYDENH
ncbi:hypothetical protein K1F36_18705, partial [Muricauda sp. W52]|nr:hypothetical protein [Allomuricauda abyssi]